MKAYKLAQQILQELTYSIRRLVLELARFGMQGDPETDPEDTSPTLTSVLSEGFAKAAKI